MTGSHRRMIAALIGVLLLIGVGGVGGQERSIDGIRFDVTIDQIDNAANRFVVTEARQFRYNGAYTRGTRTLPRANLTLIEVLAVEFEGTPLTQSTLCSDAPGSWCVERDANNERIRYTFPREVRDETIELTMRYSVTGAIRAYPGGDQIWWTAVPANRDYPVASSRITLVLPSGYAPRPGIDPIATEGAPGSVSVEGERVIANNTATIAPGMGFTIRVQFPHNPALRAPSWQAAFDAQRTAQAQTVTPIGIGALLAAVAALFGLPLLAVVIWNRAWRPAKLPLLPDSLTEPPADVTPAQAAELLGIKHMAQLVIATLMHLGTRGALRIERTADDFIFTRLSSATPRSRFEKAVVDEVFIDQTSTQRLSDLRERLPKRYASLADQLRREIDERGWMRADALSAQKEWRSTARTLLFAGIITILIGIMGALPFMRMIDQLVGGDAVRFGIFVLIGIALIITSFICRSLARRITPYTLEGAIARAKSRAFCRFLGTADRYKKLGHRPHTLSDYLPYAVAFGLDRQWLAAWQRPDLDRVDDTPVFIPWFVMTPHYPYDPSPFSGAGSASSGGVPVEAAPAGEPGAFDLSGGLDSLSQGVSGGLEALSSGLSDFLNDAGAAFSPPAPSWSSGDPHGWSGGWSGDSGGWSGGWSGDSGGWSGGGDWGGDSGGGDWGGGDSSD